MSFSFSTTLSRRKQRHWSDKDDRKKITLAEVGVNLCTYCRKNSVGSFDPMSYSCPVPNELNLGRLCPTRMDASGRKPALVGRGRSEKHNR